MRFREGSRVEVSRRKKEGKAYGSWVPARILSKDGRRYTVRYELLPTCGGEPVVEEKVHGKDVRPRPPRVHEEEKWVFGDVVEVFDLHSWRVAKIAKVLGNKWYVVRLCGSAQIKKFHVSDLRMRQSWHANRWTMLGEDNENKQLHDSTKHIAYLGSEADHNVKREEAHTLCRHEQDYVRKLPSSRTINKTLAVHGGPLCGGAVVRANKKKIKLASETREIHRPTKTLLPKDLVRKNCMHPSSTPLNFVVEEESVECSVASCSGNGLAEHTTDQDTRKRSRAVDSSSYDDTSSSCPSKSGRVYPRVSQDELAAAIHELELHAYRTTMRALFASGPLSWEQESILTNLRLSLHISNEEHLHQLRDLLSS